jgi:hypothetical protein
MAPVRIPQLNKQPFLFQAVTAVTNLGLTDFRVLCCWITNAREAHCGGNAQCLTWVISVGFVASLICPLFGGSRTNVRHRPKSPTCQKQKSQRDR